MSREGYIPLNIVKKIPRLEQILPVYAVIVVMIYTWSLILFFWRLPSWINFSTLGEIAVIFSYMVVVNLVESILVLLLLAALSMILPPKWFHDRFVTKGSSLVLLGLGCLMYFNNNLLDDILFPLLMLKKILIVVAAILALVFLIDRISLLNRFLEELANRMIVFLYIWLPISALSLLTVLVRNIF